MTKADVPIYRLPTFRALVVETKATVQAMEAS